MLHRERRVEVARGLGAPVESLVALLRSRALGRPDRVLYRFVDYKDGERRERALTYAELDARVRALAALLQRVTHAGERALILCQPGLDYVVSFYASLYAGLVSVPAAAAPTPRLLQRLEGMAGDCTPAVVLADAAAQAARDAMLGLVPSLATCRWLDAGASPVGLEHLWNEPKIERGSLAYLQYTSGSTGTPKGVRVTHGNVLSNLAAMQCRVDYTDADAMVTWLPPYHDMGLVAHLLSPLFSDFPVTVLAPMAFLQEPMRWLAEVTRQRATCTGAPNFAYDLCVRKIAPERRAELDLSCLEMAHIAAEPIRAATIDRFSEAFHACGFRREAFFPAYGLAEATLMVSCSHPQAGPRIVHVAKDGAAPGQRIELAVPGEGHALVSSGTVVSDYQVRIVDPETTAPLPEGTVGEIWVAGACVSDGYHGRADEAAAQFRARPARDATHRDAGAPDPDHDLDRERPTRGYLRTGDLGFVHADHLFVSGRIKDLIILHGVNHYPQDFETSVEGCHPDLRPGCVAAFSVDVEGEEYLALVCELARDAAASEAIYASIRRAIQRGHDVHVYRIVLIEAGGLPKSTSGKVARRPCREALLEASLPVVGEWARS